MHYTEGVRLKEVVIRDEDNENQATDYLQSTTGN